MYSSEISAALNSFGPTRVFFRNLRTDVLPQRFAFWIYCLQGSHNYFVLSLTLTLEVCHKPASHKTYELFMKWLAIFPSLIRKIQIHKTMGETVYSNHISLVTSIGSWSSQYKVASLSLQRPLWI